MLHGKIEINHHTICEYRITNEGRVNDYINFYWVEVWGRDNRGKAYTYEWQMIDGGTAPYLVAEVMAELDRRLQ